jgi:predicted aspartyl protease
MKRIKSTSDKRLIIEAKVNDKKAYFLIDTGASIGLIDNNKRKKFDLSVGREYNGTLVGAGGEMRNVRHCNTFVEFEDKVIPQFLLTDISGVVESIERETGIDILGIISLPQMKMANLSIDCNDNEIIIE